MMLFLFMVEHHTHHIKNHILHKDTLKRAMLLINSKYTSLSLSALRLLRKIVGKGDESYNSHLIKVCFSKISLFLERILMEHIAMKNSLES